MNEFSLPKPRPGDLMPPFYGKSSDGRFYSSEEQAGRAAVIVIFGSSYSYQREYILSMFSQRMAEFRSKSWDVIFLISDKAPPMTSAPAEDRDIRRLEYFGEFADLCNVGPEHAAAIVIDRSRRVAFRLDDFNSDDYVDRCLEHLAMLPTEPTQNIVLPAPVIMLPNLLSPSVCRELIDLFERGHSFEGKMASVDADGTPINRVDRSRKSRRDLVIDNEDPVWGWLREAVFLRCKREIARAFQSEITCCDRLLIARYDEAAGWFMRHRDNVNEKVAFREFAISINLNAGDYDGGYLSFPEYNDHLYRPQAGAGIIFSASILHEATAVTRGRRYVLLTFFHGDAAEARRIEYESR
jgi:predicted 2-oxoglutarate/Fe(II)-dependent dioxygenase YbiX